jgi:hypothetical protein
MITQRTDERYKLQLVAILTVFFVKNYRFIIHIVKMRNKMHIITVKTVYNDHRRL